MLAPAPHPHSGFRSSQPTRRTRPPPAGVVAPGPRARSSPAERSARTMPADHNPGAVVSFEPSHRSQPRLAVAVVALDAGIGVLLGLVALPAVPDAMPTGRAASV